MCAVHPTAPALRACGRCGSFACAECLVALPDGSQVCRKCEAVARETALPWDKMKELGFWRAYWRTSVAVITRPGVTFATMPKDGSLGSSLAFSAVAQVVAFAATMLAYGVVFGAMVVFAPSDPVFGKMFGGLGKGAGVLAGIGIGLLIIVFYLVLLTIMAMVGQLMLGSLEHVMLRALGGKASWTQTMRGYSMAMGPNLIGLIPFCSLYVTPIWALVMRVFAYKHLHELSWGRAVAGALVPSGALFCCVFGTYAAVISTLMAGKA